MPLTEEEIKHFRATTLLKDAREAGDHWVARYAPWAGTDTAVSKTVVLVIPNRARNTDLVPYEIWRHWIYRAANIMEKFFEGTTWYWPALGTYVDKKDSSRERHLDNSLILESVAPVSVLRESTVIEELISLSNSMTVSMDQHSILLVAGSLRVFTQNSKPHTTKKTARPNGWDIKKKAYCCYSEAEPTGAGDKTKTMQPGDYLKEWIATRRDYWNPDAPPDDIANDDPKHLLLYQDIIKAKDQYFDINKWTEMQPLYDKHSDWLTTYTKAELKNFQHVVDADIEEEKRFTRFCSQFEEQWRQKAAVED